MSDSDSSNHRDSVTGRFQLVPIEERFWAKVQIGDPDECWPWMGARLTAGYGTIWVNGKNRQASHIAWELTHGEPFPKGLFACHTCDNPSCCNPNHLFLGTTTDNIRDAAAKGRMMAGERHLVHLNPGLVTGSRNPCHKLTEQDVAVIRQRYAAGGITRKELGREYGVTATAIFWATSGRNWRHVPFPIEGDGL